MPFKENCIPLIDSLSPSALAIASVNTIANDNGRLTVYNTDYTAVRELIKENFNDTDLSIIIQDSGGMATAVTVALVDRCFVTILAK